MIPSRILGVASTLLTLAGTLSAWQGGPAKIRKLNGPLASRPTREVSAFKLSADGRRAFYLADVDRDNFHGLFGVPADAGGAEVRLSQVSSQNSVTPDFQITAGGEFAVYRITSNNGSRFHLYSVPGEGGTPVFLDPFTISGESVETGFRIGAGDSRVVYLADRVTDGVLELWSVPIGGGSPLRLNGSLVSGGRVLDFALSPDGTQVVYRADQLVDEVFELFSVPIDGSAAPVRLNASLVAGGDVTGPYGISPDGVRVVFVADASTNNVFQVSSVPIGGGAVPVRLSRPHTLQNLQPDFRITGDSAQVVYRFPLSQGASDSFQLFGAPIDGSQTAAQLTDLLAPGTSADFQTGPRSEVLFRALDQDRGVTHLFRVPADGSAPATQVDDLPDFGAQVFGDFRFAADGLRVLYRASRNLDPVQRLFAAPLDGSAPPLELSGPTVPGGDVLAFQERDERIAYLADALQDGVPELFLVPSSGRAAPVRLNNDLVDGGAVQPDFQIAPGTGGTVLYRADERIDESPDLQSARPDRAALALNPPFPVTTFVRGSVSSYLVAGERVVYSARERTLDATEVYSVPLRGGGGTRVLQSLEPGRFVSSFVATPDNRRLVLVADLDEARRRELYSVPIDGSGPTVRLSGDMVAGGNVSSQGVQLSPDGRWAVYQADQLVDRQVQVFAAPVDGSAPAVLLTPLRPFGTVGRFRITPDSRSVVFTADDDFDERFELYSVAIDGRSPARRIGAMQNAGGDAAIFKLAADSLRVAYLADQIANDQFELFVTRVDGSVLPRRLSPPMLLSGDLRSFQITSDLERVLFTADANRDRTFQLFSAPFGGGSHLTVPLSPITTSLPRSAGVEISPDGAWALYRDREARLFSVAVDGQTLPRPLQTDDRSMARTFSFAFSLDSSRVLFLGTPPVHGRNHLFSIPVTGGVRPIRLNPPLVGARTVQRFFLTPDERLVGYYALQDSNTENGVYLVPIDGSEPSRRMTGPLVEGGEVRDFQSGAKATEGVYLADQENLGSFELFFTELPAKLVKGPHRESRRR